MATPEEISLVRFNISDLNYYWFETDQEIIILIDKGNYLYPEIVDGGVLYASIECLGYISGELPNRKPLKSDSSGRDQTIYISIKDQQDAIEKKIKKYTDQLKMTGDNISGKWFKTKKPTIAGGDI